MKNAATVLIDNTRRVAEGLAELAGTRVMVGVPASEAGRKEDEDDSDINNAALLYIHEHGAPEVGIPARPSLIPGIRDAQAQITDKLADVGRAALEGKVDAVKRGYIAVGLIGQNSVRRKINTGPFAPLAPATLAARKRRGFKGERILIVTGQMRNAVTYVIRKLGLR